LEFDSRYGQEIFLVSIISRLALDLIRPIMQWVPEVKRLGRQADQSLPSSSEVRNTEYYIVAFCCTFYLVLISSTDKEHNTTQQEGIYTSTRGTIHQQLSINTDRQQFPRSQQLTPDDDHFGRHMS
jgi:hypothetical protein